MNSKVRNTLLVVVAVIISLGIFGCDFLTPNIIEESTQPFAAFTVSTQRLRAHWEELIVDGSPSRSSVEGVSIKQYKWDFGDDSEVFITSFSTAEHEYPSGAEEYRVILVVVDSNGTSSDPVYIDITVNGAPNVVIEKTIYDTPPEGEIVYVMGNDGIEPMTKGIEPVLDDTSQYILLTSFGSKDDGEISSYHWRYTDRNWNDHDLSSKSYIWIKAPKYRDDIYRIVLWICDTEGLCGFDLMWI